MSNLPQSKASLRKKLKSCVKIPLEERTRLSSLIVERIQHLVETQFPETAKIATFAGLPTEPDLLSLVTTLSPKYQFYYPKARDKHSMDFFNVTSETDLEKGAFGILEPNRLCEIVSPEKIDLILCPGEAFSKLGYRLGKGGGYYDRYLAQTTSIKVGICFENRMVKDLPIEKHDKAMNFIITESEVIKIK